MTVILHSLLLLLLLLPSQHIFQSLDPPGLAPDPFEHDDDPRLFPHLLVIPPLEYTRPTIRRYHDLGAQQAPFRAHNQREVHLRSHRKS